MDTLLDADRPLITAEEFLATDQRALGDAWRYELIDGRVVAMAPTSLRHAGILINIGNAITAALAASGLPCRVYSGSGVRPRGAPQARVRIPDAMVACRTPRRIGASAATEPRPVVLFEILSPSNEGAGYDERINDLRDVEGVEEIVELAQDAMLARVHRREDGAWTVSEVHGEDAELEFQSLGVTARLAALYADL